jgi:F0F1-type ATP synthase delta subunit
MNNAPFVKQIIDQLYLTLQVDLLHLALTNLTEMVAAGEIDLILDQRNKSAAQKKAFLQKIITAIESPLLRKALDEKLQDNDLEFFRERNLGSTIRQIQHEAEDIAIVGLRLATDFKEEDLKSMVRQLEEQLHRNVALDISIERGLIGGAVVQFGTAIRDYSIRARLEQFRDHWKKAVVES